MQVGRRCAITVTVAVASASLLGVSAASADTPPAPVLTLRSPAAHPFAGRTFHLTGALTPAAAGDEVRLQRRTGGEFQTIATQPLSATGGFDFGLREKTVGAYAYRVERPADPADPATDPTDPADPPAPAGPVDSPTRTVVVTGTTLGPGGVLSAGARPVVPEPWLPPGGARRRRPGAAAPVPHRVDDPHRRPRRGAYDDADRRQPGGEPRQPAAVGDRDLPAPGGRPPGPRRRQPGGHPAGHDAVGAGAAHASRRRSASAR